MRIARGITILLSLGFLSTLLSAPAAATHSEYVDYTAMETSIQCSSTGATRNNVNVTTPKSTMAFLSDDYRDWAIAQYFILGADNNWYERGWSDWVFNKPYRPSSVPGTSPVGGTYDPWQAWYLNDSTMHTRWTTSYPLNATAAALVYVYNGYSGHYLYTVAPMAGTRYPNLSFACVTKTPYCNTYAGETFCTASAGVATNSATQQQITASDATNARTPRPAPPHGGSPFRPDASVPPPPTSDVQAPPLPPQ